MIDLDADIVPGRGLGGFALGELALERVVRLEQRHRVAQWPALDPRYTCLRIDEALLLIVDNRDFAVVNLAALPDYRGRSFGYVRAGMRLRELIAGAPGALLKTMSLRDGFLYLDRACSAGFRLPPAYEDVADRVDDLPEELSLDELYVLPPCRCGACPAATASRCGGRWTEPRHARSVPPRSNLENEIGAPIGGMTGAPLQIASAYRSPRLCKTWTSKRP